MDSDSITSTLDEKTRKKAEIKTHPLYKSGLTVKIAGILLIILGFLRVGMFLGLFFAEYSTIDLGGGNIFVFVYEVLSGPLLVGSGVISASRVMGLTTDSAFKCMLVCIVCVGTIFVSVFIIFFMCAFNDTHVFYVYNLKLSTISLGVFVILLGSLLMIHVNHYRRFVDYNKNLMQYNRIAN